MEANSKRKTVLTRVLKAVLLFLFLYFFLVSIELISISFKLFGEGFANHLLTITSNPIIGLFIGIIATSLLQSSSCTTSIVVGMVAAGVIPLRGAIPIVMGANIGTTVTNILVSLAHITRPREFERAFSGAIVHDNFNLLSVIILLPLEIFTHYLERSSTFLANLFSGVGGIKALSPLKIIIKPPVNLLRNLVCNLGLSDTISGIILLIVALVLLFLSLSRLVKLMKSVIIGKIERLIHDYLFAKPLRSMILGMLFTAVVQSSSIVTSLAVPLVGAGILSVEQIFPYTLGSNLGTTITALLASLVTQSPVAIATAFVHLLFNFSGIIIWYPLRKVPISIAKYISKIAAKRRWFAFLYIGILFYGIPLLLISITGGFK